MFIEVGVIEKHDNFSELQIIQKFGIIGFF